MFRDGLRGHGQEAGRRQDHQEPGPEEAPRRPADEAVGGSRDQPGEKKRGGEEERQPGHDRRAIIEDQRTGPQRQPEVDRDRPNLGEDMIRGRNPQPETDRMAPAAARGAHQRGQEQPGAGERGEDALMPRPRGGEAAADEGPVVEDDQQRRGRHGLLRGHARQAGEEGKGEPALKGGRRPAALPLRAADEAVEREEVPKPHERFRALDHIGDGFGLQGMHRPKEPERACAGKRQDPAGDAEERQPRQDMDRQVEEMVAPDLQPADGIVGRKREVEQRAAVDREIALRRMQGAGQRPEVAQGGVFDDRPHVIQDEGSPEAVPVGGEPGAGDDGGGQRDGPAGWRAGRGRRRGHAAGEVLTAGSLPGQ